MKQEVHPGVVPQSLSSWLLPWGIWGGRASPRKVRDRVLAAARMAATRDPYRGKAEPGPAAAAINSKAARAQEVLADPVG